MTVPHATLLSGSIGLGHDMMARACAEVLEVDGWTTRTLDSMRLLGGVGARVGAAVTARLMSTPAVHDALHFAHLRTGSRFALAMAGASASRLVPAVAAAAADSSLLLSVFATGAQAAAAVRRGRPDLRTVVLCTDATPHRLWVWPDTDLFLVTSPAAEAAVRRFQPRAAVQVVPAPIRRSLFTAPPRPESRTSFGIPDRAPCVLMMDSGWGFGPAAATARALAAAGVHVLAVAGRDPRLPAALADVHDPRLHVFGFTDDVGTLMSAADLVICLPGATTCSEARALGRPLLLLDLMPGHGRDNLQQQLDLGDAWVCDATPAGTVEAVLAAFERGLPSRPRLAASAWPDALTVALRTLGFPSTAPEESFA